MPPSERTRGDVLLFSTSTEGINPLVEAHLAEGGTAALIEHDTFVVRRGRLHIPVAPVRDVPLTLGGAARFQFGNILAAIAAAFVQGMRYQEIQAGLRSFFPSPALTPGRRTASSCAPFAPRTTTRGSQWAISRPCMRAIRGWCAS